MNNPSFSMPMRRKIGAIGLIPFVVLLALIGLLAMMGALPSLAQTEAAVRYVTPGGSGVTCTTANPCALQDAANLSANGDEIRVAGGLYLAGGRPSVLTLTAAITLSGGYNAADWNAPPDPQLRQTILDGGAAKPVVRILGGASPTVEGFVIRNGRASQGAGIYNESGRPLIRHNQIHDNQTNGGVNQGGGAYDGGTAVWQDNQIYQNQARFGGGVYVAGTADTELLANEIYSNTASASGSNVATGGGVNVGAGGSAFLDGNTIYANGADFGGGLAAEPGTDATVWNSLFYGNDADGIGTTDGTGGAIFIEGSGELFNNTIVSNTAEENAGGVQIGFGGTAVISNTIIAFNSSPSGDDGVFTEGGAVSGGYNNLYDDTSNVTFSNPVSGDPQFADPAGHNYHLLAASPAIDAGDPATSPAVDTDIDGQFRPNGPRIDVGADEYYADVVDFTFTPPFIADEAARGRTVVYSHQLENVGTVADGYTFTCSNSLGWAVACPSPVANLDPYDAVTVDTAVTIPPSAAAHQVGQTLITATSTASPTLTGRVVVATTVAQNPAVAFTPNYSATVLPGETITFTHHLTNAGDYSDTFDVALVADPFGWAELLPSNAFQVQLAAGESQPIDLRVTVPDFAAAGFANTAVVQANSVYSPAVSAAVSDTVTAKPTVGARHVAPFGVDLNNNCTQPSQPCGTVARGVGQAAFGDEVRLAGGFYPVSEIALNDTIHLSGGWNNSFNNQNDDPSATVIDAGGGTRIFNVGAGSGIRPTVANLTLQNGTSSGPGGAVRVGVDAQPAFENVVFLDNQGTLGGAIYVGSSAFVEIDGGQFSGNVATLSGGGLYMGGGAVAVRASQFLTNTADSTAANRGGGAIFAAAGVLRLENSLLVANQSSSDGGALRADGGQVAVVNNTFQANQSSGDGGAIYNAGATAVISNTILAGNTAVAGGAVYQQSGATTLDYNDIWNNSAPETNVPLGVGNIFDDPLFADGLYRLPSTSPAVDAGDPATDLAVDFEGDFRPSDLGYDIGWDELAGCLARWVGDDADLVYGSIQDALAAPIRGSDTLRVSGVCRGVRAYSASSGTIRQTVYLTQSVTIVGGWDSGFQRQDMPTFIDPEGQGRAFYVSGNVTPTIASLIIVNGDAAGLGGGPAGEDAGGGVYNLDARPTFTRVAIFSSTAVLGGGFYNDSGTAVIQDDLGDSDDAPLRGAGANSAVAGGGFYNQAGTLVISSTIIHNNGASSDGGGVYNAAGGALDMRSAVLAGNTADSGGGVYNVSPNAALLHLTLYDNSAAASGGGVYNTAAGVPIRSSLFQDNSAPSGPALFASGGAPSNDYNYYHGHVAPPVAGTAVGPHSIVSATPPGLVDPAAGDFHLADDAPAAEAADPTSPVTADFEGDPRPSNQGFDIGADEQAGCYVMVGGVLYGSIQEAINAAGPGDEIRVSGVCRGVSSIDLGGGGGPAPCGAGVIFANLILTRSVHLSGGWDGMFNSQNSATTLDAEGQGRVIYVAPGAAPVVEGFNLTGGDAATANGNGGAVCIDRAAPTLSGNAVYSNTATNGGAIYAYDSAALLDGGNRIYNNTAVNGGGVYLTGVTVTSTVQNNFLYDNVAQNGGGFYNEAGDAAFWHNDVLSNTAVSSGGGIYVAGDSPVVRNNIVVSNTAVTGGGAFGAAGATADVGFNDVYDNAGGDYGGTINAGPGALSVDPGFADLEFHLTISSPVVDMGDPTLPITADFESDIRPSHQGLDMGADEVGGCYARLLSDPATVYGSAQQAVDLAAPGETVEVAGVCYGVNERAIGVNPVYQGLFVDKSLTIDGGWNYQVPGDAVLDAMGDGRVVYIASGTAVTLTNLVLQNGDAAGAGLGDNGGGLYNDGQATLIATAIAGNTAVLGGGVYNDGAIAVQESQLYDNSAISGGAFYNQIAGAGTAVLTGNELFDNSAANDGGAVYQGQGMLNLDANALYDNVAALGGGVYLNDGAFDSLFVTNNFIYENRATVGGGLYNVDTDGRVWHNTVVSNTASGGDGGGLYTANGGPDIRNNIVDRSVGSGVHAAAGAPTIGYNNVISSTGPDYGGIASDGGGGISAPPLYVDPAADDYHLLEASPGVDVAQDVGLDHDIDGDVRPTNGGPDMGADEVALCLIRVGTATFGVLQEAIDYAELNGFSLVEIARGACSGVQERAGSWQVGHVSQDLTFVGSLRRSDFSDPGDYYSLEVGTLSSVIDAGGQGRGIVVANGAQPVFRHLAFVNGDAGAAGGNGNGGAVYNPGDGFPQFQETFFCQSDASDGGAYYGGATSNADFTGMRFGSCTAARVTEGPSGGIDDVTYLFYDGNSATNNGGGLYIAAGGQFDVRNVSFYNNTAGDDGGGAYNAGTGRFINGTFYSNQAGGDGGGLHNSGDIEQYHNTIRGNTAVGNGGGVFHNGGLFTLNSSLIYDNAAASGGGVHAGSGTLDYNNVYSNTLPQSTLFTGTHSFSADPQLIGTRSLSRFSPNIDRADPALLPALPPVPANLPDIDTGLEDGQALIVPETAVDSLEGALPDSGSRPEGLPVVDYDYQLDIRPDGNPNHTGLYGKAGDVGADEYFKDFGCDVDPNSQSPTADPGEIVTYAFTVTNVGYPPPPSLYRNGYTDTLTVTLDSQIQGWGTLLGGNEQTVELDWFASQTYTLVVTVPPTATTGMQERSVIRCRSASMPSRTSTGVATTNIGLVSSILVYPDYLATAVPGDVLTFTHTIVNDGNQDGDFTVTPSSGPRHANASLFDLGGDPLSGTVHLAAGEMLTVQLRVHIFDTGAAGATAAPGVVVRSVDDPLIFGSAIDLISIGFTTGTRYVAAAGSADNTNCTDPASPCATIQYAVDQASPGDEIRVSAGVYANVITRTVGADVYEQALFVNKSITVTGGYDAADGFTAVEPITNAVTLSGQQMRRVVHLRPGITVTLNSLFIEDGRAFYAVGAPDGQNGGGIYNAGANLTLNGSWVLSNTAQFGAGLYHAAGDLHVKSSAFAANVNIPNPLGDYGRGGGIFVASGAALLENNTFANNQVNQTDSQALVPQATGQGGALFVAGGGATLLNNAFAGNGANSYSAFYITQTAVISNDYNLFFNHPSPPTNVPTGTHSVSGDPQFLDGLWHIGLGSAGLNAGTAVPVTSGFDYDFDREPRLQGPAVDIGADEYVARLSFSLTPLTGTAVVSPGGSVAYDHVLRNTGNAPDSYTLAAAHSSQPPGGGFSHTLTPTAVSNLDPGQSVTVTLVVTAGLPGYVDVSQVTATAASGGARTVTDTTRVDQTAGVAIGPSRLGNGGPGDVVVYSHTLTNTGDGPDQFSLSVAGATPAGWGVTVAPTATALLLPGETTPFTVAVTVPPTATAGTNHQAVIEAVAQDPFASDQLTDTTAVAVAYALSLTPDNARTVPDGTTAVYSHTLTNLANVSDTISLAVAGSPSWPVAVSPTAVSLAPLASQTVVVSVTVPPDSGGQTHTAVVTAASGGDPAVQATATDTTTVQVLPGVILAPDHTRIVDGGTAVAYTHTLTNSGNLTDTFDLSATSSAGWLADRTAGPVTLPPNGTATVTATVAVPAGLPPGSEDVTVLTATSQADSAVSDDAVDTTRTRQMHALRFFPDNTGTATPGGTAVYSHTLVNDGDGPDTFAFTASSSQGWAVDVPAPITLDSAASATIAVSLTVPAGAGSVVDTMLVTATSVISPAFRATVSNTTAVLAGPPVYGVAIEPDNVAAGSPGQTIQYLHTVTNTGTTTDTINLSAASNLGWTAVVQPSSAVLGAGQSAAVTVDVTIPAGAAPGQIDTTTVTAVSTGDPSAGDSATDKTTVLSSEPPTVYLPIVFSPGGGGPPPTPTPTPSPSPTPVSCTPTGVDLVVTEIRVEPATPAPGAAATVFVTIKNQGTVGVAYGNNFYLDFYIDRLPAPFVRGDLEWGVQGVQLTAGASKTFSGPYAFAAGLHQLWAQVDSDRTVDECPHEDNNVMGPVSLPVTAVGQPAETTPPAPAVAPPGEPRSTPTPLPPADLIGSEGGRP